MWLILKSWRPENFSVDNEHGGGLCHMILPRRRGHLQLSARNPCAPGPRACGPRVIKCAQARVPVPQRPSAEALFKGDHYAALKGRSSTLRGKLLAGRNGFLRAAMTQQDNDRIRKISSKSASGDVAVLRLYVEVMQRLTVIDCRVRRRPLCWPTSHVFSGALGASRAVRRRRRTGFSSGGGRCGRPGRAGGRRWSRSFCCGRQ